MRGRAGFRVVPTGRVRGLLACGLTAALMLLGWAAAAAQATGCDTSWNGANGDWSNAADWSNGVPTTSSVACINASGNYTVTISGESVGAGSLELGVGAASGTQTLKIEGTNVASAGLALNSAGGTIAPSGHVELTVDCSTAGCATANLSSVSGALANQGTIKSDQGGDSGSNLRELIAPVTNTGTIELNAPMVYGSFEFDNNAGGTVTNDGGTSALTIAAQGKFFQGAGTTSPSTAGAPHPAVILNDTTNTNPPPKLDYTGTGASTIEIQQSATLVGNLAPGQNLIIQGAGGAPCIEGLATTSADLTNAGTIKLVGCGAELAFTGHQLTNTGLLDAAATGTNAFDGQFTNAGTFDINGPTAIQQNGTTTSQTGGTTSIAGGQTLELNSGSDTFDLQGGVLNAPGSALPNGAIINGGLNNSGGNVIPGTSSSPGDLAVDIDYTQGAGGTLTAVLHGTQVGRTYSQLGVLGNMTIAGKLVLVPISGFVPSTSDTFTVLGSQSGSLTGKFSTVTPRFPAEQAFPPGWTFGYQPFYTSNAAGVSAVRAAGLRVRTAGPGTGSVTSSPAGINCASQCDAPFFSTQTVTLTAHPGSGWAFGGWLGSCTGSSLTCTVSMTQARTVTAAFSHRTTTSLTSSRNPVRKGRKVTYTATVSPHPDGGTVKFTGKGKTISGCGAVSVNPTTGRATCSTRYHTTGSRKIRASYSGDTNFAPSSGTLTERVKRT